MKNCNYLTPDHMDSTNFIAVMPINIYDLNDNFDLEKSHVLPALIRKIHLGKALEKNDWETIRKDLSNLPIESIDGKADKEEILAFLKKYGIQITNDSLTRPKVAIEIWGSSKPMREFLWNEDMANACVFLMEKIDFADIVTIQYSNVNPNFFSNHQITKTTVRSDKLCNALSDNQYTLTPMANMETRNTHINIGTRTDISIRDLAQLIKEIIEYCGKFYFDTSKTDGTMKKLTAPIQIARAGVEAIY